MSFQLRIPSNSYPKLKKLLLFEKSQKKEILDLFKSIDASIDNSCIDEVLKTSDKSKVYRPIIKEIMNLYSVYNVLKEEMRVQTIEEFIKMIKESFIDEFLMKEDELTDDFKEKVETLEIFLVRVFKSNNSIPKIERAKGLLSEREKIMINTRILTDFRPVFEENAINDLSDGIILHNLRIKYLNKNRNHETLIFALDHEDLLALQDNIRRALKKEEKIKNKLKSSKIKIIE